MRSASASPRLVGLGAEAPRGGSARFVAVSGRVLEAWVRRRAASATWRSPETDWKDSVGPGRPTMITLPAGLDSRLLGRSLDRSPVIVSASTRKPERPTIVTSPLIVRMANGPSPVSSASSCMSPDVVPRSSRRSRDTDLDVAGDGPGLQVERRLALDLDVARDGLDLDRARESLEDDLAGGGPEAPWPPLRSRASMSALWVSIETVAPCGTSTSSSATLSPRAEDAEAELLGLADLEGVLAGLDREPLAQSLLIVARGRGPCRPRRRGW